MSGYHLTHPEPVAPDCPMCGDPLSVVTDDPCPASRAGWLAVALVFAVALAAVAWRCSRV